VPPVTWAEEVVRFWGKLGSLSQRKSDDIIGRSIRIIGQHLVQGLLLVARGGRRPPFAISESLRAEWMK